MKLLRVKENFSCKRIRKGAREKFNKGIEIASEILYSVIDSSILDKIEVDINTPIKRTSSGILCGWYRRDIPNQVTICTSLLNIDNPIPEFNEYRVARTIIHEIGHLIHHLYLDSKVFSLPVEGMSLYARTNFKEDFAEAFADWLVNKEDLLKGRKVKDISKRNKAIENIVKKYIIAGARFINFNKVEDNAKHETNKEKFSRVSREAHRITKLIKNKFNNIDYRAQYGVIFKEIYRNNNFKDLLDLWA